MIRAAICDDEPTILDYLYEQILKEFERQGADAHIDKFTSGRDFLNYNREEPFDVVFLDIKMPDISGFEVAAEIRGISEKVYIIFITTENTLVYDSFSFQPFDFIPKTPPNGVYESAVLKALENHLELKSVYLCTDNDEGGIEAAERLRDILHEHGYENIFRIAPQQKDWNEILKQRYGAEYLPAVPHERKELYLQSVAELNEMKINPNRISNDLIAAYNSADRIRLAEFSLAASEHFLKIAGEKFSLDKMKNRLTNEYKCYQDKGTTATKLSKLQDALTAGLEQLRKPSQTATELKITARKLYDIADHALRLSTEETIVQRAEQKETSEEVPSDEPQMSMSG